MPDMSKEAIHAFWDSYDRRTLYRIVVALEKVETWTLDKLPTIEKAVMALGEALDNARHIEISNEAAIIRVLVNISSPRAMRLLQALDLAQPGTASKILMYAEEITKEGAPPKPGVKHAKVFLRRNLVFERLQLLSRIFAPQRISLVSKALGNIDET